MIGIQAHFLTGAPFFHGTRFTKCAIKQQAHQEIILVNVHSTTIRPTINPSHTNNSITAKFVVEKITEQLTVFTNNPLVVSTVEKVTLFVTVQCLRIFNNWVT
jgi:hypothetical protein